MKFSIGIPAFKASYLKECINSILCQTYSDFELIIVNDASPEDLETIVGSYDDKRIRYYRNTENCGAINVVDNWNNCLMYAKGDYFILMGDDDKMSPNYLEEFTRLIKNYPDLHVYHCRSYLINEKSEVIGCTPSWPEYENVYENIYHRMKGLRLQYISDFVYDTNELKRLGGFFKTILAWAADDISSFRAASNGGVAHTQEPIFCYRQSQITISATGNVNLKLKAIQQEEEWYCDFLSQNQACSKVEKIFKKDIEYYKDKYFKSKRKYTIVNATHKNILFSCFLWYKKRKTLGLSSMDILYVFFKLIKAKNI